MDTQVVGHSPFPLCDLPLKFPCYGLTCGHFDIFLKSNDWAGSTMAENIQASFFGELCSHIQNALDNFRNVARLQWMYWQQGRFFFSFPGITTTNKSTLIFTHFWKKKKSYVMQVKLLTTWRWIPWTFQPNLAAAVAGFYFLIRRGKNQCKEHNDVSKLNCLLQFVLHLNWCGHNKWFQINKTMFSEVSWYNDSSSTV